MTRSSRTAVLVLALALVGAAPPAAATRREVLVVGGDRDYPPYEFLDRNGVPAGYNVDLTRAIAEVMGMQVEFRLGAWAEVRAELRDGTIDALQGMSWSEERASQFDLSQPHTVVIHAIVARKGVRPGSSRSATLP